jgi:hypothetical protein
MAPSTAQTQDKFSPCRAWPNTDWTLPQNAAFLQAKLKRDTQVGEVLRELHYLEHSEPPNLAHLSKTEEDYWIGQAQMSPGYELTQLQATLARRKKQVIKGAQSLK